MQLGKKETSPYFQQPVPQLRNRSQIVLSDDTHCNQPALTRLSSKRLQGDGFLDRQEKFDQSGKNKIPIGMCGQNESIKDRNVYSFEPKKLSLHPVGFYQNSRLNSKGAMHDYSPRHRHRAI